MAERYRSGDTCPECKAAKLRTITSKARGEWQQRRLKCKGCGCQRMSVVPVDSIWKRRPPTALLVVALA